jgi:hypothetical protein
LCLSASFFPASEFREGFHFCVERNNGFAEKDAVGRARFIPTRNAFYNTVQEGCRRVARIVNRNESGMCNSNLNFHPGSEPILVLY